MLPTQLSLARDTTAGNCGSIHHHPSHTARTDQSGQAAWHETGRRCTYLVCCVVLPHGDVGCAHVPAGAELDAVLSGTDLHCGQHTAHSSSFIIGLAVTLSKGEEPWCVCRTICATSAGAPLNTVSMPHKFYRMAYSLEGCAGTVACAMPPHGWLPAVRQCTGVWMCWSQAAAVYLRSPKTIRGRVTDGCFTTQGSVAGVVRAQKQCGRWALTKAEWLPTCVTNAAEVPADALVL